MKSNTCIIKKGGAGLDSILNEVEKVTFYNELSPKEALRIRLLAEELTGMLSGLIENFDGVFWMLGEDKNFELHVELSLPSINKEIKDNLIDVSKSKKNASASGFMGKIREIAENMLLYTGTPGMAMTMSSWQYSYDYGIDYHYSYAWTLDNYVEQCKKEASKEQWDQLEKSIVAKLADDVIVGVRGKEVDIIIKKSFK